MWPPEETPAIASPVSANKEAAGRRRVSLLLGASLLVSSIALATTLQKLSLERLAGEADLIVRAHVKEVIAQATADRSHVTTSVVLAVVQQFKGNKTSRVGLQQLGGSAGEITQRVMGTPLFSVGEEVILFLKKEQGGYYVPVGGKQGKFTIKTDSQTARKMVQDLTGMMQDEESFVRRVREIVSH